MDTTVLSERMPWPIWNLCYLIHLSVICCGRAIPLIWKVMEYKGSAVAFREYKPMLRLSHLLLSNYCDVMLLAIRGFAAYIFSQYSTTFYFKKGAERIRWCYLVHPNFRSEMLKLFSFVQINVSGSQAFSFSFTAKSLTGLRLYVIELMPGRSSLFLRTYTQH